MLDYSLKVHGLGLQAWCLLILPGFLWFFLQCPEVDIFRHFIIMLYYIRMLQVAEPWFRSILIIWFQFVSESAGFLCSIIFCEIDMLKIITTCHFSGKVPNLVHWPAFQNICPPQSWHFSLFPSCCVCPLSARCLYPDAFPSVDLEGLARQEAGGPELGHPKKILYKVAWPGKTPEKSESMLVRPLYRGTPSHSPRPLRTANASIKWPDRVKPPKNHNRCWSGHFIEALHPIPPDPFEQRMPL